MPYVMLAAVLVVAIVVISVYNELYILRKRAEEAFSLLDVYYKTRCAVAVDFAAILKDKFEKECRMLEIVAASECKKALTYPSFERINSEHKLSALLSQLVSLSESESFSCAEYKKMMAELDGVKEEILNAEKNYNAAAKAFNIKKEGAVPSLVSAMFGFKRMPII